jgi:hypothetical protein
MKAKKGQEIEENQIIYLFILIMQEIYYFMIMLINKQLEPLSYMM